jgi:hypothetical protein
MPFSDERRELLWELFKATTFAVVLWAGESLVGLVPLLGHIVVTNFSVHVVKIAHCSATMTGCTEINEYLPIAEINIISVVTCGLGLLSLLRFGPDNRRRLTPMTYLAALASLGLLIISSLLYALMSAGIGANGAGVTVWILCLSLAVSFFLALEAAWLRIFDDLVPVPLERGQEQGQTAQI